MGNSTSSDKTGEVSLAKQIDYVATNYILTQNFRDMEKLADADYCNNLVIMTSEIIANNLNDLDVRFLAQRTKDGVVVDEMDNERVLFLKKSKLDDLDVSNKTTKRRLCIGLAKHYVKAAHLFSAILTTINPTYSYKDSTGRPVQAGIMQKADIPEGAKTKQLNICSKRLNALVNNKDFNVQPDVPITVSPDFCGMNYDRARGKDKNLDQEPGIPELEKLYYDIYDYDNGGFTGMSDAMKRQYENDVLTFYQAFTGNKSIPLGADGKPVVTKFSQIPLRDFHRSKGCGRGEPFTQKHDGTLSDPLFKAYADHINKMMKTTSDNQDKLVTIIDTMFLVTKDKSKKSVVLSPALTEAKLQDLVVKARGVIIDLYIGCESDFIEGLELFEAIVESKMRETSNSQIEALEAEIANTIASAPSTIGSDSEEPTKDLTGASSSEDAVKAALLEEEEELLGDAVKKIDTDVIASEVEKLRETSSEKALAEPLKSAYVGSNQYNDAPAKVIAKAEETISRVEAVEKDLKREKDELAKKEQALYLPFAGIQPYFYPQYQVPVDSPENEDEKNT